MNDGETKVFWPRGWDIIANGHIGEKPLSYTVRFSDPLKNVVCVNLSPERMIKIGTAMSLSGARGKAIADPME